MLLLTLHWIKPYFPKLSRLALFEYITVRSGAALALAFLLCLIIGPLVIRTLRRLKTGGQIRKAMGADAVDVYATHAGKKDTPIMGGIMIIASVMVASLIFCDLRNPYVWIALIMLTGFAAIGFLDDLIEIKRKREMAANPQTKPKGKGMSVRWKLAGQAVLGAILACLVWKFLPAPHYDVGGGVGFRSSTFTTVPFFKHFYLEMGIAYIGFVMLVVCATSNAVNLTDGLDGLAIGITIIASLAIGIVIYLVTRVDYAAYLYFPYIKDGDELVIIMLALVGAGMGFLWYNAHPAEVFMGDTGSLAIGGLLGTVAVMIRQELLLLIIGGIFVLEALSVIVQVLSYRFRKKRVFLMAPIHHHFEKKGWPESKIIARFWIIAALLALAGLSTLKIR
ncbi:MAG: phospho-N-acetylmuramoyl-pentapeptide-transferase [Candidatus Sumerlaeota bacterium]|nr:phospho-N-acetylmuramoyl-pentapeptide-transferase [Candidatus Sumerlaeota bacterium]